MNFKQDMSQFKRAALWGIILVTLAILAAPWSSARALSAPVISSDTLQGPYTIDLLQSFFVTAQNPADGAAYDNMLFIYTISSIQLADITTFEFYSPLDDTWYPVYAVQDGSNVTGYFGPAGGFPMSAPYDVTSQFRIQLARGGDFPVAINLVDLNNGSAVLAALNAAAQVNFIPPQMSFGQSLYLYRPGDLATVDVVVVHDNYTGMPAEILEDARVTLTPPAGVDLGGLQINGSVLVSGSWTSIGSITLAPGQTQFWLSSFPGTPYRPSMVLDSMNTCSFRFQFSAPASMTGVTNVQAQVIGDDDFIEPYYLTSNLASTQVNILGQPSIAFSQSAYAVRPGELAVIQTSTVHANYLGIPSNILEDTRFMLTPPSGANLGGLVLHGAVLVSGSWTTIGNITLAPNQTQFWLSSFPGASRQPLVLDSGLTQQYRFTCIPLPVMTGLTGVQAQVIGDVDFVEPYYLTSNLASTQVNILVQPALTFSQPAYIFAPGELATINVTAVHTNYLGVPASILSDVQVTLTPPPGVDLGGLEISGSVWVGGSWTPLGSITLAAGQIQFWLSSFPSAPNRLPLALDSGLTYPYRFQFTPLPAMTGITEMQAQVIGDDDFLPPYYLTSNLAATQVNILARPVIQLGLPALVNFNALAVVNVNIQHANYAGLPIDILGDVRFEFAADISLDGLVIEAFQVENSNEIPYGTYTLSGGSTTFWLSDFGHSRLPLTNVSNLHLQYRLKFDPLLLTGRFITVRSWVVGALAGHFENPADWYLNSDMASAQAYINARPTEIGLDNTQLKEHGPAGTLVGHLSVVDDNSPPYTYQLTSAAGCDGSGNASFMIAGNQLQTSRVFSWDGGDRSFSICIQVSDGGGLTIEKNFTIQVLNLPELLLPVVMNEPPTLRNGDFSSGFEFWTTGRGAFEGHGSGFNPQVANWNNRSLAALIGSPAYQNGAIPVGYGYISQRFVVTQRYLKLDYELHTFDVYKQSENYYDTFEVSINQHPSLITTSDRDTRCNANLNPVGSPPVTAPSDGGLVFCGGGIPPMPNPPVERIYPEGTSRTVILDLQAFQSQVITLYLALWSREYSDPYWDNGAYYNSWVYMTNFVLSDTIP